MVSRYLAELERWMGPTAAPHHPPAEPDRAGEGGAEPGQGQLLALGEMEHLAIPQ